MNHQNDWNRFSDLITAMSDLYKQKLSAFQVKMFWEDLKRYSWEQVNGAATEIRRTHVYNTMPKPAEFVQIIDPPGDPQVEALDALGRFRSIAFRFGVYDSIVIVDDPAMVATINTLGGWLKITSENRNDFEQGQFDRDFRKTYAHHKKTRTQPPTLQLTGRTETENRVDGYLDSENQLHNPNGTVEEWHPIYLIDGMPVNQLPNGQIISPLPAIGKLLFNDLKPAVKVFGELAQKVTKNA